MTSIKSGSTFARTWSFRVLLPVLFFLCSSVPGGAQSVRLDSLGALAAQLPDSDNRKADILHAMAAESWCYDFEEGLRYAQQANEIARKNSYVRGLAQSLNDIGDYYYFKGDYPVARQFYQQALEATGAETHGSYPVYTLVCLGNLYRAQAMFDSARLYYDRSLALISAGGQTEIARWWVCFSEAEWYKALSRYDLADGNGRKALEIAAPLGNPVMTAASHGLLGDVAVATFNFDTAEVHYAELYRLGEQNNNTLLQFGYYHGTAELAYQRGEYGRAIKLYSKAVGFLKKNEYKRFHPEILKKIGQIYRVQGDFNRALEHFLNALQMNEELGNRQETARVCELTGWLYLDEQSDSLARAYANRSLALATETGDDAGMAGGYNLLGFIEYRKKSFESALDYFARALRIRRQLRLGNDVCATLFNMAQVYYEQGLYAKAMEYYERIVNLDHSMVDKQLVTRVYNSLAQLCIEQQQYDRAGRSLKTAEDLARFRGLPVQLRDTYRLYAELSKRKGDFRRASDYYERYIGLNDSLFNTESIAKAAQLGAVYQLSDKEHEIRLLNQENELKQSQITVQQSRLKLQRNILISSVVCIVLLAVIAYVLYMYYRGKHKAHKELTRLHQDISEKNEEIQAQAEELIEANASLTALNHRLVETQEEIQAQSEELMEANEIISSVNRDLEAKVQVRTEELKQAYIELDTFFYRSSHDFRRPLTTFLGLAEVAKITVKNQNALELFEKVKDTALNLDKMLVKLQSISDVGTQQLAYKQVFLKELVLNITDTFRADLDLHGIRLDYDFGAIREFYSYPALVKIIIENLVENAIHFCGTTDPYLHIRIAETENDVVIAIADNGQGISDELSDRIFEMYFRANHHSKGNGLGLYIVKKAVEKIHGHISFTSTLHKGSVFTVTVPFRTTGHSGLAFSDPGK